MQLSAKESDNEKLYKERVFLHTGQDTYIAGEKIWFKAYCRNMSKPEAPALSKVIYVELVNAKSLHVFGHILNADNGTSESCFDLPDTLTAGVYFLKAYTQWMENFGPESFFSQPIFIYNYYSEGTENKQASFNIPIESKVFIEGNKLIGGIRSKVAVSFPNLKGKESQINVIEKGTNKLKAEFRVNATGEGVFDLIPVFGNQYTCVLADSNSPKFEVQLPEVTNDGYKINIVDIINGNLKVKVERNNQPDQKLELEVLDGKVILDKKTINSNLQDELNLSIANSKNSLIDILLKDTYGRIMASNIIRVTPQWSFQFQSLQKEYNTGEKVDLSFLFNTSYDLSELNGSISICKEAPALKNQNVNSIYDNVHALYYFYIPANNNYSIAFPKYNYKNGLNYDLAANIPVEKPLLPVENLGIIYNGIVTDKNHNPVHDINIIFSVKDSIPNLQSVNTKEDGKFALMVDLSGNPQTFISLYKDMKPVTGQYEIIFDKKFFYQDKSIQTTIQFHRADSAFVADVQDDAQRALIQRVFSKRETEEDVKPVLSNSKSLFYSSSVITVITDDFFTMPNFEEIAREILPRVQYRKSKEGCSMTVATTNPESKSYNPLVLLNGVVVEDKCDLYDLNSELISKIYIQHEPRIVGNLFYEGLVSIITVPTLKSKYLKSNSENLVNLPSFNVCPDYDPMNINKSFNTVSNKPDFRNMLYWDSVNLKNKQSQSIHFITSDEEGNYIVELSGFLQDGTPVSYQETFTVQSK